MYISYGEQDDGLSAVYNHEKATATFQEWWWWWWWWTWSCLITATSIIFTSNSSKGTSENLSCEEKVEVKTVNCKRRDKTGCFFFFFLVTPRMLKTSPASSEDVFSCSTKSVNSHTKASFFFGNSSDEETHILICVSEWLQVSEKLRSSRDPSNTMVFPGETAE